VYRSYNQQITCEAHEAVHFPKSIDEVQSLVHYAIKNNLKVKAIGSRHSATDVICSDPDGIAINMHGIDHMTYNSEDETVTTGPGVTLAQLQQFLDSKGRGLISAPSFGGITIGGGVAIGVHGSTLLHHACLSDFVVSLKVIDGLGNIQVIDKAQDLRAFRVNLGLLGIVVQLTLYTVPQYKVQVTNYEASEEILLNGVALSLARKSDYLSLWWLPDDKSVVVGDGNYISLSVPGNASSNLIPDIPRWQTAIFKTTLEV